LKCRRSVADGRITGDKPGWGDELKLPRWQHFMLRMFGVTDLRLQDLTRQDIEIGETSEDRSLINYLGIIIAALLVGS
jgi:hypothetical protein